MRINLISMSKKIYGPVRFSGLFQISKNSRLLTKAEVCCSRKYPWDDAKKQMLKMVLCFGCLFMKNHCGEHLVYVYQNCFMWGRFYSMFPFFHENVIETWKIHVRSLFIAPFSLDYAISRYRFTYDLHFQGEHFQFSFRSSSNFQSELWIANGEHMICLECFFYLFSRRFCSRFCFCTSRTNYYTWLYLNKFFFSFHSSFHMCQSVWNNACLLLVARHLEIFLRYTRFFFSSVCAPSIYFYKRNFAIMKHDTRQYG